MQVIRTHRYESYLFLLMPVAFGIFSDLFLRLDGTLQFIYGHSSTNDQHPSKFISTIFPWSLSDETSSWITPFVGLLIIATVALLYPRVKRTEREFLTLIWQFVLVTAIVFWIFGRGLDFIASRIITENLYTQINYSIAAIKIGLTLWFARKVPSFLHACLLYPIIGYSQIVDVTLYWTPFFYLFGFSLGASIYWAMMIRYLAMLGFNLLVMYAIASRKNMGKLTIALLVFQLIISRDPWLLLLDLEWSTYTDTSMFVSIAIVYASLFIFRNRWYREQPIQEQTP